MSKQFENAQGMPQEILDLVKSPQKIQGGIFSGKRFEPLAEYDVLDVRWGSGQIFNWKEMEEKGPNKCVHHPTFQLLVKNKTMKRARWTKSFPVRGIRIIGGKEVKNED